MEVVSSCHNNNGNQFCDGAHNLATHIAIAVCGCGNDGRLGLGSLDSQSSITLLPFFLPLEKKEDNNNGIDVDDGNREVQSFGAVHAVRVGGYHNFAITTTGVYGWGLNENGQLGLGRGSAVYLPVPTRIPFFDGVSVIDIACGAYHTFAWTSNGLFACGKNDDGQLGLPSEIDHFFFTRVLTAAQTNNNSIAVEREVSEGCCLIQRGQLTHVSCGTHHTLLAFRDVVVSKGEEDEMGQEKYSFLITAVGKGDFGELGYNGDTWSILQAKAKTLRSALHSEARQQEVNCIVPEPSLPEKKWKPIKQRRALFSSFRFQPVELFISTEWAKTFDKCSHEVVSLYAMHLHSAVVIQENYGVKNDTNASRKRTFHWGCYYCNAVEDDASSIPRELEVEGVLLHAGNEALFRYVNTISPSLGATVEVMGSGVLGLGEEDSYVTKWTPLPLPQEASGRSVLKMTGREHYFILLENTLVLGFGDNMHGQIGVNKAMDAVLHPTIVLQAGDCIRSVTSNGVGSLWKVDAIFDVACGVRHSVFLVECVRRQSLAGITGGNWPSLWRHCSALCDFSSGLSVHPELIKELQELLEHVPSQQWIPVGTLYNDLSLDARRRHVRPHKTFAAALAKAKELGVHLNQSGLMFCKGIPPKETEETSRETNTTSHPTSSKKNSEGICSGDGVNKLNSTVGVFMWPSDQGIADSPNDVPPVDFYYDVGLREYPPPPPDFDVTTSTLPPPTATGNGTVLSLSSFVSYIPPFFVPLEEVLEEMTGYTEEHIERYFRHRASEVVKVAGRTYIRLHGGYAKFALEGCEVAEARFARYRPDPSVLGIFIDAFGGVTGRWMPLRILLERVGHAGVAKLPFKGPASIIYFAQMQHIFAFAVDREGGSVLLRPPGYDGLECETTPTPKSCNCILRFTPLEGQVDIRKIEELIPVSIQEEVKLFYGTLLRFFQFHAAIFSLSADGAVVMRRRFKDRLEKEHLSLEEQLEIAIQERNKKKIRSLRRRIAFRNDPSNPFHDPDNLARELHRYLPKKGHVPLKAFLKKNVPEELLNYLPRRFWNFFSNYPQYFQHFEYQVAGQWCVCRPGLPLPRGVIRQEFSEEDLVKLIAEFLQQRGPKACSNIILHLPRGAQEAVRKRYGGIFYLVRAFPQYFNIVLPAETGNVISMAMVHLVEIPGAQVTNNSKLYGGTEERESEKWDNIEDIDDEDEDQVSQ